MRTRLTDLLGVEHPVMLAGMGGVSYSALAAAVSNAGGYGCLGASTMSSNELAHEIAATRLLTSKPFGVDLLTAFPDSLTSNVELLIEGGASIFVAGLGVPRHVIDLCHDHGVLVVSMCGKVEHARRALEAGCDVVKAQRHRGGWPHHGTVATFPLVPLIVDAVEGAIPVVAAGGVFDGPGSRGRPRAWRRRGVDRQIQIYRDAGSARLTPAFANELIEAHEDDTVVTRAYSGKTMRVIKNDTTERYQARPNTGEEVPRPTRGVDR